MEWSAVQHLDLGYVGRGQKPLQPHAAAFHPNQALIAAAIGNHLIEFDALTGSKLSSTHIGAPVARMSYSPRAVMPWFLFLGQNSRLSQPQDVFSAVWESLKGQMRSPDLDLSLHPSADIKKLGQPSSYTNPSGTCSPFLPQEPPKMTISPKGYRNS